MTIKALEKLSETLNTNDIRVQSIDSLYRCSYSDEYHADAKDVYGRAIKHGAYVVVSAHILIPVD
jgi:hypothetical protein